MKRIRTLFLMILIAGGLAVTSSRALTVDQTPDAESGSSIDGQSFLRRDILVGDVVVSDPADEDHATSDRLGFSSSPATTQALNEFMAEDWSAKTGTDRGQVQQLFNSGELQSAFASRLRAAGFSTDRLDDVMAGYLIIMYEIAHDIDTAPNAAAYPVVRDRVRSGLLQNRQVRAMTDAEKQGLSEALALLAMLAWRRHEDLGKVHDTQGRTALQHNVQDMVTQFGLDITSIELTTKGFVAR